MRYAHHLVLEHHQQVIQIEGQSFAWRSWRELLLCQKTSKLRASELEAVLKSEHQNRAFSSCFGPSLLELAWIELASIERAKARDLSNRREKRDGSRCNHPLAAGSENALPMLNKENPVHGPSRLLRRMIPEPGDADREVPVPETIQNKPMIEPTVAEMKQMEADDQAIQHTIL
ncbi:hypothetical protein Tco_1007546 [Tanacetum coccineum]